MTPSRILVLHNRYREPGGEDRAVEKEVALLREHGHEVIEYAETNEQSDDAHALSVGLGGVWSNVTYQRLKKLIAEKNPCLAHFHNTFYRISPSAYYVCRRSGLPVVQTLHNFRMGCVNAGCARNGLTCDACISSSCAWRGVWHGCYRESWSASAWVAAIVLAHRAIGTYRNQVDAYISTSEFARGIHIRSGVPSNLSFVKPNFCIGIPAVERAPAGYALFAGRLVREKGIYILLEAWRRLRPRPRLKIAGGGPESGPARRQYGDMPEVEFLGRVSAPRIRELMARADFLIQPSLLWENCALTVIEALGAGLPSVVSGHGSFTEIVEDGRSGLYFRPGDSNDLAAKVSWLASHQDQQARMAEAARERFEQRFTPDKNYAQLMAVYEAAGKHRGLECPYGVSALSRVPRRDDASLTELRHCHRR